MEVSAFSVSEAARELGVSERRVRQLVEDGLLEAERVGRQLLIDPQVLRRYRSSARERGRPLAPLNAWAFLHAASGGEARLRDRKAQWRVLRYGEDSSDLGRLAHRMSRRAEAHRLRAHPQDAAAIGDDPRLVLGGVSAARHYGLDIMAPGVVEAYVDRKLFDELRAAYILEPDDDPNVIVRVVSPDIWALISDDRFAPSMAAALDLLEANDDRSRRAARQFLLRHFPSR
jgi:excisionase family DNA binding protein